MTYEINDLFGVGEGCAAPMAVVNPGKGSRMSPPVPSRRKAPSRAVAALQPSLFLPEGSECEPLPPPMPVPEQAPPPVPMPVPAAAPVSTLAPPSSLPPTFAEAVVLIESWPDLSTSQRGDLVSALRGAARIIGKGLSDILCCPAELNGHLFSRSPASAGIGEKRFQNIVSGVRRVLRRLGRHSAFVRGEAMLGAAWHGFMDALPDTPRRAGLRNFARWCDGQGILPDAVTDTVLAAFLEADRRTRLAASAIQQGPRLAAAWNWALTHQPEPARAAPIKAPARRVPYTLPFEAYPESFQASVRAFAERIGGRAVKATSDGKPAAGGRFSAAPINPFRTKGRTFKPLKPASVDTRLFAIRQAAAALVLTGMPIGEILNLSDLVHPVEHAGRILDFYDARAGGKPGGQVQQIAETLRQIGCFHADIPEESRAQLIEWAAMAKEARRGEMGPKARTCLLQLIDPRNRARLLHLPQRLAREAAAEGMDAVTAARLLRQALLIELWLTCPLRISDLRGLLVEGHLVYLDADKRTPSHIRVPQGSSKTGEPISWPLAATTRKLLRLWLDRHRATLGMAGTDWLFPGMGKGALSVNALRQAFQKVIRDRLGLEIYPHAMRHFAAYLFLKANPGQYEVVRRILGHRSVETTIKFYCGLETDAAAQAFDEVVTKERTATRLLARAAGRRGGGGRKGGTR